MESNGISIHALREEGDPEQSDAQNRWSRFLSTPSARRATKNSVAIVNGKDISIHALREEGDVIHSRAYVIVSPISIHALREEGDLMT